MMISRMPALMLMVLAGMAFATAAHATPVVDSNFSDDWLLPLVLLGIGLMMLFLEFGVVPGFGFTGIAGFGFTGVALYLGYHQLGQDLFNMDEGSVTLVASGAIASLATTSAFTYAFVRLVPYLPFTRKVMHSKSLPSASYPDREVVEPGMRGVATTDLRPSGNIELGGKRYDVVTTDGYISAGEAVSVEKISGNQIVVRRVI